MNKRIWLALLITITMVGSVLIGLVILSITGCATPSKWEYRAARISRIKCLGDCKARTFLLHQEMQREKVPHYIVWGLWRNDFHKWIQLVDGTIIDGAIWDVRKEDYKVIWKSNYGI